MSKFWSWIGGLREQASSLHPPARIIGVVDFYHPVLDDVGEFVGFPRTPGQRDEDYQFHLGVHLSAKAAEIDELLKKVLNYKRGLSCDA